MKYYLFLIFIVSNTCLGQNYEKARQSMIEATNNFYKQKYGATITQCRIAEKELGYQHEFIFLYLIPALYEVKDFPTAQNEINSYKKLISKSQSQHNYSILQIESEIKSMLEFESTKFSKCISSNNTDSLESFLKLFPYSEYRTLILKELESIKWENLLLNPSLTNKKDFIVSFPNSNKINEIFNNVSDLNIRLDLAWTYLQNCSDCNYSLNAKSIIKERDSSLYESCKRQNTQESLRFYLNNYPAGGGSFQTEILKLLKTRIEYDDYNKISQSNDYRDLMGFLSKYPTGIYYKIVLNKFTAIILNNIKNEFDNTHYNTVIEMCIAYDQYVNDRNSDISNFHTKSIRHIDAKDAIALMYHRDRTSQYGFGLSTPNVSIKRLPGFYINFRFNENFSSYGFYSSKYDYSFYRDDYRTNKTIFDDDFGYIDFNGLGNSEYVIGRNSNKQIYSAHTVSFGTTIALSKHPKPVWLYVGTGWGNYLRWYNFKTYNSWGGPSTDHWMLDEDFSNSRKMIAEVGLKCTLLKHISLEGGISIKDQSLVPTVGIGFSKYLDTPWDRYWN